MKLISYVRMTAYKASLIFCILNATLLTNCLAENAENNNNNTMSLVEVQALIENLNRPFDEASSLSYLVERSISSDKGTVSDSWMFLYSQPGKLRIEYLKPESRLIIKNENYLWEYIRQKNCAMQIDISDYSPKEEAAMLSSALKRVALPGLKPGKFENLPDEPFKKSIDGDILTIANSSRPKYVLKINKSKNVLLQSEIYDSKGQLDVKSTASEHRLISDGFWFPALIKNTLRNDDAYIETTIKLSAAKAGEKISDERFIFKKPPNAVIIEK